MCARSYSRDNKRAASLGGDGVLETVDLRVSERPQRLLLGQVHAFMHHSQPTEVKFLFVGREAREHFLSIPVFIVSIPCHITRLYDVPSSSIGHRHMVRLVPPRHEGAKGEKRDKAPRRLVIAANT